MARVTEDDNTNNQELLRANKEVEDARRALAQAHTNIFPTMKANGIQAATFNAAEERLREALKRVHQLSLLHN